MSSEELPIHVKVRSAMAQLVQSAVMWFLSEGTSSGASAMPRAWPWLYLARSVSEIFMVPVEESPRRRAEVRLEIGCHCPSWR